MFENIFLEMQVALSTFLQRLGHLCGLTRRYHAALPTGGAVVMFATAAARNCAKFTLGSDNTNINSIIIDIILKVGNYIFSPTRPNFFSHRLFWQ